jgi:L-ascorbate metabolism protein UlaG (beta-lactamase superfamily)
MEDGSHMPDLIDKIRWLGHSGFRVEAARTIYIDPWQLAESDPRPADLLLLTHDHDDHFSPEDIDRIRHDETVVITTEAVADRLRGPVRRVKAGETLSARGVTLETVPAYNLNKTYHPREEGYLGFVIGVDGERLYHAGDSDLIPEMSDIRCDVALLPVSGTYVMTADEAAQAAALIVPQFAVPMHYGSGIGTETDARCFAELCPVQVRILKRTV